MKMEMEILTPKKCSEIDEFNGKFSTGADVLQVFAPNNWGQFLKQQEKCLTAPHVSLSMIAEHYGQDTTKELVLNQFIGLYNLTSGRDYNSNAISMAADLFLSQYGPQITPYALMLYFALYPVKYRDSYREFDPQDILRQCTKFIRWWQAQQPQPQEQQESTGISLEAMMRVWINEGRTDEDFHTNSGLYAMGMITDTMIAQAREEVKHGIF